MVEQVPVADPDSGETGLPGRPAGGFGMADRGGGQVPHREVRAEAQQGVGDVGIVPGDEGRDPAHLPQIRQICIFSATGSM